MLRRQFLAAAAAVGMAFSVSALPPRLKVKTMLFWKNRLLTPIKR